MLKTYLMPTEETVAAGLPISVETGPHYLAFNAEDVQDGNTLLKCAPPIRDTANQLALFQGLKVCTSPQVLSAHACYALIGHGSLGVGVLQHYSSIDYKLTLRSE